MSQINLSKFPECGEQTWDNEPYFNISWRCLITVKPEWLNLIRTQAEIKEIVGKKCMC